MTRLTRSLLLLATLFSSGTIHAQASRTWVSGVGDDANPCSRTAPCKTFAGAISKTAANGKINVLDPAGFGAVTITKSITIEADGAPAGILAAGTNGIIINALPADHVTLRNIKLEGFVTGLNGIRVNSGGTVLIDNCVIEDFGDNAILVGNTSATKVVIRNSVLRRSGNLASEALLSVLPSAGIPAQVTVENSTLFATGNGIRIAGDVEFNVRNSVLTGGALDGFLLVDVDGISTGWAENVQISDFGGSGISVNGSDSMLRVVDSTITNNAAGLAIGSGGQIISFGDNRLAGNVANGAFTGSESKQ